MGAIQLESRFTKKDLGVLVETKLNMSQQHTIAANKDNILGCTRKIIANKSRDVIVALCSALMKPHMECCVQFWVSQYKRYMDILERVQQFVTKRSRGLEHLI